MSGMKPVAVVGLGAILPDAFDVPTFWNNIKTSRYSITNVPADRWKEELYYHPDPNVPDKTYSKIGGWVKGYKFEPFKWGIAIPPRVIEQMDEVQGWAIGVARQALFDYGYPERKLDLSRVAVILGNTVGGEKHYNSTLRIRTPEFMEALRSVPTFQTLPKELQSELLEGMQARILATSREINEDTMPGELSNVIAGRVANVFNFQGPNFTIDAACASSLAALQSAVEGLNNFDFDAAISGGIDRMMGVEGFVKFSKIGALSPDGSRPYADGANGFVMGEGTAVFLLKRLEDAERDGDRVYAVIRGIGGSSDGKGKGITAPNPAGQLKAIERAWTRSGLNPASVRLIEGHGTSTRVGDVVEVNSLTEIFGKYGLPARSIALGSVKSNFGHLKSASGAAGVLKTVLALHEKLLPPSVNFNRPNPNIDFDHLPFFVNSELRPWEIEPGEVRRAGVSSFGFGGTNFHAVMEEYIPGMLMNEKAVYPGVDIAKATAVIPTELPAPSVLVAEVKPYRGLLFLSAETSEELKCALSDVINQVKAGATPPSNIPTADQLAKDERIAIDYGDADELIKRSERALKGFDAEANPWPALIAHGVFRGSGKAGKVAFLFPGQGSQYVNMLKDLSAIEPIAAQTFAEADRVMEPILGRTLTSFIYVDGDEAKIAEAEKALRNTEITQPAMLTANVALLRLMERFGFEPDMVIGHSLGEYAALVSAGVLTFAEALEVVSARGQEMKKVSWDDNGCMAAVSAPIEKVEKILESIDGYVVIANINSPMQSVIGGSTEAVDKALTEFAEAGFQGTKIPVSHAFHTRIVAPASKPLRKVIEGKNIQAPKRMIIANVTGEVYPNGREEILDLLARQVASPVQFVKGMQTLYANGARVFIEIGPKRVLNALANDNFKGKNDVMILATNHPREGAVVSFNKALCGLYAAGVCPRAVSLPKMNTTPPVRSEADREDIKQFVLGLVSEKTGYPPEMLDLDLDLEADLGIDTVKQAELFVAVRTQYGIPRRDDLRLSDYNTLAKVIQFVTDSGGIPESVNSPVEIPVEVQQPPIALTKVGDGRTVNRETVKQFVLGLVSEKTGYPTEMLDLGLDLEADLGIDTVKQAELFAAVRTNYEIPRRDDLRLSDYTTLDKVIDFVVDSLAHLPSTEEPVRSLPVLALAPTSAIPVYVIPRIEYQPETGRNNLEQSAIHDGRFQISGSVVISGAGLGLPGKNGYVFNDNNIESILNGEMRIENLPEKVRLSMLEKRVTRLIKSDAGAVMETIDQFDQTVKLGGQRGLFNLAEEFNVPEDRVNATDISTQLAIGAGIDALRDAGIPLVMRYKQTTKGTLLPDRWMLPESLADETGVIFGSAFPGLDQMATEMASYYEYSALVKQADELRAMQLLVAQEQVDLRQAINQRIRELEVKAEELNYAFDRRFVFRVLPMGHSQFAEHIGARGPNTHVNGACASTTQAIAIAEDWIRTGRTRRVVVIAGDDITSGDLMNWVGTGLMASGAATIEGNPRLAILPFDRRRNGMIMGMGGAALVVESEDAVRDRGMRGIAEVIATNFANSAYHGTRLDVGHVSNVMESLMRVAESRFGIRRDEIAPKTVFVSHETYTPARGGSASAEIRALRSVFGEKANQVVIANTKGFTGHTMGVGIEDVVAVKALETGRIPPIANIHDEFDSDPDLGELNLSKGGQYDPEYSLRLGAGFGSQIAMTLMRKVQGATERIDQAVYRRWLGDISGYENAELEVVKHTLRIQNTGTPTRAPRISEWEYGQVPTLWSNSQKNENIVNGSGVKSQVDFEIPPVVPVNPPSLMASKQPFASDIVSNEMVKTFVLGIVSEKTGYPQEMLDLDLDLEADLGIDTVKQAELFATIRTNYEIPRREDLRLSDYNTLAKVIGFVTDGLNGQVIEEKTVRAVNGGDVEAMQEYAPVAVEYPRRVPVPVLRPRLDLCVPTGILLGETTRIVIVNGQGKVGEALARRLRGRKVQVLVVNVRQNDEMIRKVSGFTSEGTVDGIYFLTALDEEPALIDMDSVSFQVELDRRTLALYSVIKAIPGAPFLVCATRMGGLHGYGKMGASAPMGGAVSGLTKSLGLERQGCFVKVIDFERDAVDSIIATRLIAETVNDPAVVEVGWEQDLRYTINLVEKPAGEEILSLAEGSVFVVSGGSGGITGPVVIDLARVTKGTFYLLSRTSLQDRKDDDLARLKHDRNGLKADLMRRLAEMEEKATPAVVEQKIAAMERISQTLETMAAIESAGGKAIYLVCDITDRESVESTLAQISADTGCIDVLIHAAGVERSRKIENKSEEEFRQTLKVKAVGFFNLFRALTARGMTPKSVVMFSSIAGRFGNTGQTDYSAANDYLCKLAANLRSQVPDLRAVALDWGAWAEVGMASRGFIPELMKRAKIEMLQPASAAGLVRREICCGDPGGEVILAGSLGILMDPKRADGGLDLEKTNTMLSRDNPMHTLLTRVSGLDHVDGVILEAELDPNEEPFLRDHALNGIPLLPGVMGIEGLSMAAYLVCSFLASEKKKFHVFRIDDVNFLAPLKFYRGENRKVTWKAIVIREENGLVANVILESALKRFGREPETLVHFSGRVFLESLENPVNDKKEVPPYWNGTHTLGADDIYRLYFHGPTFQVLAGVQRSGELVLGKLRENQPALTTHSHGLVTMPMLVELCMQTAGVWEIGKNGSLALPSKIESLRLYQHHDPMGSVYAEVTPNHSDEGGISFNARVLDSEGRVYLELENYRTQTLPYTVEKDLLDPIQTWLRDQE